MAQYDIWLNPSHATRGDFPYLLEVQSDVLAATRRRVVIPMTARKAVGQVDQTLHPSFEIGDGVFVLMPFEIAAVVESSLGNVVGSLKAESDSIVGALDLLFARY
jgi:toxin CcdB